MLKKGDSFGLAVKQYQKYRASYDLRIYRLFASLLGKTNKQYKFLDIGCGTGKSTEPLVKFFKKAEIVGCDPDEKMLGEARLSAKKLKLPISYIKAKAEKLSFEDNYFDAIISGTAFHWFDEKKSLEKIKIILKKGGAFFVFWNSFFRTDKPVVGAEVYKKYGWELPISKKGEDIEPALFKKSGFLKVKTKTFLLTKRRLIKEAINEIKTYSTYLSFSEKKKKYFIKEITEAYEKEYGNKKYFMERRESFVCYGFKK